MHPIFKKATAGVIIFTSVSFYGFATAVDAPDPVLDLEMSRNVEIMGHVTTAAPRSSEHSRLVELTRQLGHGPAWSRGLAAQLLGDLGDERALAPLIASLSADDAWVATKAAEALGKIASSRAVPALVHALATGHHTVRREACRALRRIGGPESRRALSAACRDESPWVRRIASAPATF